MFYYAVCSRSRGLNKIFHLEIHFSVSFRNKIFRVEYYDQLRSSIHPSYDNSVPSSKDSVMSWTALYLTYSLFALYLMPISSLNWGQLVLTHRIKLPIPSLYSSLVQNTPFLFFLIDLSPVFILNVQISSIFKFQFFWFYVLNSRKFQACESKISVWCLSFAV